MFTSSMSGQIPHAGSGAYSPTKAALTLLAQTLALEWAPDGIRVNVVSPGMTRTGMNTDLYRDPAIKKGREEIIPLSRIGQPIDIANVIEFLIGPLAGYVTGQDICVDGGFSKSILSHIHNVCRHPKTSFMLVPRYRRQACLHRAHHRRPPSYENVQGAHDTRPIQAHHQPCRLARRRRRRSDH